MIPEVNPLGLRMRSGDRTARGPYGIQLLSAALVARGTQRKAKSQARSHEKRWELQLDMRRQFDAQGMKPGMKVNLILTK